MPVHLTIWSRDDIAMLCAGPEQVFVSLLIKFLCQLCGARYKKQRRVPRDVPYVQSLCMKCFIKTVRWPRW